MTSGDYTVTEAWNLQLQMRVRELEGDLAEAERRLRAMTEALNPKHQTALALKFLARMQEKRRRSAEQAAAVEALLRTP
jgi:ATP/maltotriose-dependent transcriptional regulator MalT